MIRTAAVLMLAGCALGAAAQQAPKVDERALRLAFDDKLKDAESARFREIQQTSTDRGAWDLCGEVNAKNGMGGYAGYTPFLAVGFQPKGKPIRYTVISIGEAAGSVCRKKFE